MTGRTVVTEAYQVSMLNPYQRRLVLLIGAGNSQASIASTLGISQALLASQMQRVRDRLSLLTVADVRKWAYLYKDLLFNSGAGDAGDASGAGGNHVLEERLGLHNHRR